MCYFQIDFEHFKDNFVQILCQSTKDRVEQQNDCSPCSSVHEQFMDADQFEDADEEEEESEEDVEVEEDPQRVQEVEKHEEEETKEENGRLSMKKAYVKDIPHHHLLISMPYINEYFKPVLCAIYFGFSTTGT